MCVLSTFDKDCWESPVTLYGVPGFDMIVELHHSRAYSCTRIAALTSKHSKSLGKKNKIVMHFHPKSSTYDWDPES